MFMTKGGSNKLQKSMPCGFIVIAALISSAPLRLAVAQSPPTAQMDLTPTIIHHEIRCPAPGQGKCLIRKPVATGYRVLTPGVDLEDAGDHWIGNFTKAQTAKAPQTLLRVMDRHEVLHEITITFSKESAANTAAAKSASTKNKSAKFKKKPAKKSAKKSTNTQKQAPAAPGN
jgi:hypothetical protein